MPRTRTRTLLAAGLSCVAGLALTLGAATTASAEPQSRGGVSPKSHGGSSPSDIGRAILGSLPTDGTAVVVNYSDGDGGNATWVVSCKPTAGTLPDPSQACAVLKRHADALKPTRPGQMCTMIYGGAQSARIVGLVNGKLVASTVSRADGCEVQRWNDLTGLVPPT